MDTNAPASSDLGLLRYVADRNGVATGYWDWYGNWIDVSAESLLEVLRALGVPVSPESTVGDLREAARLAQIDGA